MSEDLREGYYGLVGSYYDSVHRKDLFFFFSFFFLYKSDIYIILQVT